MNHPTAMAARLGSWRTALRISRREAVRHRARNLLIVAMLALPVLGAVAADTIIDSTSDLTAAEQVTRAAGGFDAMVQSTGDSAVYQSTAPQPDYLDVDQGSQAGTDGDSDGQQYAKAVAEGGARISSVLPGAAVLPETDAGGVLANGPTGFAVTQYHRVDLRDPAFQGVIDLTAGRVPRSAGEVDLTPAAASALGVRIGDSITVPGGSMQAGKSAAFTVVGLVLRPDFTKDSGVFALPSAPAAVGEIIEGWFVHQSGGVTWDQVQQLNRLGLIAASRAVVLDPPAASQVPYDALKARIQRQSAFSGGRVDVSAVAIGTITVGIALLEVILLAGPAFAVSARRREREYAMLGAAGADAADLRRIVLADGVVLGAVAGVCGVGLGIGAAAAVMPLVPTYGGIVPGALHVDALHAAGVALLAIVLGLCSAYVPARAVARRDIMATLDGRRAAGGSRRARGGRVVAGLLLAAAGLCGVFFCRSLAGVGAISLCVVGGIALVEIGGIMCTPAVVAAVAGLGRFLPLGPRLALRDSARNSGRTTPAVAAMFVAVAGAVAAGGWLDSSLAQQRAEYQPQLLSDQVAVGGVADPQQAARIVDGLHGVLPVTGSVLTRSVDAGPLPGDATDSWTVVLAPPGQSVGGCPEHGLTLTFVDDGTAEAQCSGGSNFGMVQNLIGDGQVLRTVTGVEDARADAALAQGGIVVFAPGLEQGGKVTVSVQDAYTTKQDPGTNEQRTRTVTVPAVYVPANGFPDPAFVLAPATAHALGIDADTGDAGGVRTLILDLGTRADAGQLYAGNQALSRLGVQSRLTQEIGLQSHFGLVNLVILAAALLVAIGAAAIATGLALADGRRDQETISAVGGSPWTRRWLAGSTALVVTGLGVLIGVPVGFAISEGLVRASAHVGAVLPFMNDNAGSAPLAFQVPWLDLGVLAVAVPLLTASGAMLLSRSRAPGSGRAAD